MTADGPEETAVRVTPSRSQAEEWSVVLAASGIAFRVQATEAGWALIVAGRDAASATDALRAYDEENREGAEPGPGPADHDTWIGSPVGALLLAFFAITGPWERGAVWFERGAASAERIVDGEWWRAVTALTLHADLVHALGNALASILLVSAVGRSLGAGLGTWLVLLAGAGGNALTALVHGERHVAVGASTASFGAIGILAGLQFVRRRRAGSAGGKAWMSIAAGVALLGLLGVSPHSDFLAHLFGLLAGGGLGAGAALALRRTPGAWAQRLLLLTASGAVAACWLLAFSRAVPQPS
jgi:membrane associated rhomboid family serine protease